MEDLIAINILIADRTYRIRTRAQDEESIRKTAKLINEKITEFKTAFAGKDMQDYISMVLLWLAVENSQGGNNVVADKDAGETIEQMNVWLDKALTSE